MSPFSFLKKLIIGLIPFSAPVMKHPVAPSFAVVILGIVMAPSAPGAPAPRPKAPVGYDEWQKTGELPRTLDLEGKLGYRSIVISTPSTRKGPLTVSQKDTGPSAWRGIQGQFPGFGVGTPSDDAPTRRELIISAEKGIPLDRSTYVDGLHTFNVGNDDVIPLYDQLYAASIVSSDRHFLRLSRVTDLVPQELRPTLDTRTISTAAVRAELFIEQNATYKARKDLDYVSVEFQNASEKAIVKLHPTLASSGGLPPEGRIITRQPLTVEVAKGEFLSARGRSYKVVNVVPPQDIKGVGHLVGWIELAPEPVGPAAP